MKVFTANISHRGRFFDVEFCAKGMKEAAEKIGVNMYYMKVYVGSGRKIEKPFEGVKAVPYCHNSRKIFESRKEYDWEYVKKTIDEHIEELNKNRGY